MDMIISLWSLSFLAHMAYITGAVFIAKSVFDPNLVRGADIFGYRARGGIISAILLIGWILIFPPFVYLPIFSQFDINIFVAALILGTPVGLFLYRLFSLYNGKLVFGHYPISRRLSKGNVIFWAISSAVMGIFIFAIMFGISKSLLVGVISFLIFVPLVTYLGARTPWLGYWL